MVYHFLKNVRTHSVEGQLVVEAAAGLSQLQTAFRWFE